jgi:hypothetical protein
MKQSEIISRLESLLIKSDQVIRTKTPGGTYSGPSVDYGAFVGFRSAGMSFISSLFGFTHPFYTEFERTVSESTPSAIEAGKNILLSIKYEIENGWLTSFRQIISAEVFSDFLEMSKHLLDEKYKDPSAVMIGSIVEEHLRQLCNTYAVDTFYQRGNDMVPKKAEVMNADLVKAGVYGVLEQKNVTAWLDLRNRAAHGKYGEYVIQQVEMMYQGVLDFVSRVR